MFSDMVYLSARRLLGGHAPAPAPGSVFVSGRPVCVSPLNQVMDAQRAARRERMLDATATSVTVLFVVTLSCVVLTALYYCRVVLARMHRRGSKPVAAVPRDGTKKRALERISARVVAVVVVVRARDGGGSGGRKGGGGAGVAIEEVEEDGDGCAVCLAEYAAGDEVRVLPACRHGFHRACVDQWLLTRAAEATCPVCRAPIDPIDEHDAKEDCAIGRADAGSGGIGGGAGSRVRPAM